MVLFNWFNGGVLKGALCMSALCLVRLAILDVCKWNTSRLAGAMRFCMIIHLLLFDVLMVTKLSYNPEHKDPSNHFGE